MNSPKENFKPNLYVVSRMIKALVDEGPQKKTAISTKTGLSNDNLIRYLDWMSSKDIIRENDWLVHVAERGIKTYNDLVDWIITCAGKLRFGEVSQK